MITSVFEELSIHMRPRSGPTYGWLSATYVAIAALAAGCSAPAPPADPHEALASAASRIDALLAASRTATRPTPSPLPPLPEAGDAPVRFWYYAHPLMTAAFDGAAAHTDATPVESSYIGEWPAAVQKLMVSFAADDLPDVGMVKRGLVAKLYESRRIRPLDSVLPQPFIDDLRPEVIADYTYDGRLIALPADGFCSVLYYNKTSTGAVPPKTWAFLTAFVNAYDALPAPRPPHGLGAFPFMEALWSVGGNVLAGDRCALGRPEVARALDFVLGISDTPRSEAPAFDLWVTGQLAMTVASSSHMAAAKRSGMDFGVAPVPGETGPISRRSDDAVVVFAREDGAGGAAIAAFLDGLTGPKVMGERAADAGSVPLRRSTQTFESRLPAVAQAYAAGRNTPLHPDWGAVEAELDRALAEAIAAMVRPVK